jgi:hypothetical protein
VRTYDLYAGRPKSPAITVRLEVTDEPPSVVMRSDPIGEFLAEAQDLVGCLMQLRARLESDGYLLACQGALPDVWATGPVRASNPGYALHFNRRDGGGRPPLVDIFLPVPLDRVVSMKVQRALNAIRDVRQRL